MIQIVLESKFGECIKQEKALLAAMNMYNIEIADPMILFCNRLGTFSNWKFKKGSCTAENMAYAGYYVIQDDCAKCVFCFKELDGWEETDNPWEEHKSHKPDCAFVQLDKGDVSTWLIEDFTLLNNVVVKNKMMEQRCKGGEELSDMIDKYRNNVMDKIKKLVF